MIKHIIFDYDGVLVDSFNFHLNKYNEIFDVGLTRQELADAHNGNFYENKSEKFDLVDIQKYATTVATDQEFLPLREGVQDTLHTLAQSKTLHLVTSGFERQILPNLEHHKIEDLFAHLLFADHGKSKHEKILRLLKDESANPDDAIFVTDTLGDVLEAKEVPITCIALTCGFQPEEIIRKGEPDYMFDTWAELHALLTSL